MSHTLKRIFQATELLLVGLILGSGIRAIGASSIQKYTLALVYTDTPQPVVRTSPKPTKTMHLTAQTSTISEPTAISTPYFITTGTITPSPTPAGTIIPRADEQVYRDPAGWYAVRFPADWISTGNPNSFAGENGFFETGYLPDMMYMRNALDVCQWLANITFRSVYNVSWNPSKRDDCELRSLPGVTPSSAQLIIQNPVADPPQRFLYIKTSGDAFGIAETFAWLKPVDERADPIFQPLPLRPADAKFWKKTVSLPASLSVQEYKLPKEAQEKSLERKIFSQFIPPEAPKEEFDPSDPWHPQTLEEKNAMLKPYGFELKQNARGLNQLYEGGALVLDNIHPMTDVYRLSNSSGEKVVFLAYSSKDNTKSCSVTADCTGYLILNNTITQWEERPPSPIEPGFAPILYKDDILWTRVAKGTNIQVRNSQAKVLFSFQSYEVTRIPLNGFRSWNNHWILEISDFVIQDGEILNEKYGFEEVFEWGLMKNRPFYFFRKGQRIGLSYNGQFLSLYYDDVAHGLCCGYAVDNPFTDKNSLRFFGKRDGIWYYVVLEVK